MTRGMLVPVAVWFVFGLVGCAAPNSQVAERGLWDQTRVQVALQLADEHAKGGRFEQARALLVAHAASDDVQLQLALVQIDLEEGRYAAALDRLAAIPVERRATARYYEAHAVACEGLGRWNEAADTYERAYRCEPDPARLIARLDTLVLADRAAEARQCLEGERARFPGQPAVQAAAARLYSHLGDCDAAIDELEAALLHDPQSCALRHQLAGAYMAAGRYADSIPIWRELVTAARDSQQRRGCRAQLAACLLGAGEYDEAVQLGRVMTLTDPDDTAAYVAWATAALAAGRPAEAVEAAQHALRLDPANADARLALGCAYARWGQYGQARQVLATSPPAVAADTLVRELLLRWQNEPRPSSK